jgi:hypothetical protein
MLHQMEREPFCSLLVALAMSACGGKAVIDTDDQPIERACFDDQSCCEAAVALMDDKCPPDSGIPRTCSIDTLPQECVPFIGDIYRCILRNPEDIMCEGDVPRLACGTCTTELEAAGEPCGQAGGCDP